MPLHQEVIWSLLSFHKWGHWGPESLVAIPKAARLESEHRFLTLSHGHYATFFLLWWYCLAWIHRSHYFCLILYFSLFSVSDTVQHIAFWAGWFPGCALFWHWGLCGKDVRPLLPQGLCDHSQRFNLVYLEAGKGFLWIMESIICDVNHLLLLLYQ